MSAPRDGRERFCGVADADGRLDKVLSSALPGLSRTRVTELIKAGEARVDGVVQARPSARVAVGSTLELSLPPPEPSDLQAQDLPLSILYQDADIAVIDKAPGMVVHPGAGHRTGTLVHALLHHISDLSGVGGVERPGIVHRLDRGTSGLLVVAKHDVAHRALAGQFAIHAARRRYLALVHGVPGASGGTIRSVLARDPRDRLRFASTDDPGRGKRAITHWRRLGGTHGVGLVECKLETGRTHQIRVHLCEAGHPIVGDPTYRRAGCTIPAILDALAKDLQNRPLLHAWSLAIDHPRTGERMRWCAPLPADLREAVQSLDLEQALPAPLRRA
ncbi:MAG: RluA family pseudouridine synthase [Deltaproteobacteria bacterium]|nr:MAG: RluA family pseudouridine synthase [Deltaproteobacteria bacterium]